MEWFNKASNRWYLYRILQALLAVALVYGWIDEQSGATIAALGGAILGLNLAADNVPKDGKHEAK